MLITEAEAKTKWCPHVRISSETGPYNRANASKKDDFGITDWSDNKCIGAACMAWHWYDVAGPQIGCEGRPIEDEPDPTMRRGYCGLAGAP